MFRNRFSHRCGAFNSPCVFKCKSQDALFEDPQRDSVLASQQGQLFREVQRGPGDATAKEKSLSAVLSLQDLFRHSLFHFHVIKIEMYNSCLSRQGRQSAGESFVPPCGWVTGRRQALGKHLWGPWGEEPLLDHPPPAHIHTCNAHTSAHTIHIRMQCTRNTHMHAHVCTHPFSPKSGPDSEGNKSPGLS